MLELRDFVSSAQWLDERRQPVSNVVRDKWVELLNNPEKSDIAAINFNNNSDHVEVWYTKLRPFAEFGLWDTIPGIVRVILTLEAQEREKQEEGTPN